MNIRVDSFCCRFKKFEHCVLDTYDYPLLSTHSTTGLRSRRWLLHHTVELCRACHSGVHSLFDEETLARSHHSLDKLMREEKGAFVCVISYLRFCKVVLRLGNVFSVCLDCFCTIFHALDWPRLSYIALSRIHSRNRLPLPHSPAHGQVPGQSARDERTTSDGGKRRRIRQR